MQTAFFIHLMRTNQHVKSTTMTGIPPLTKYLHYMIYEDLRGAADICDLTADKSSQSHKSETQDLRNVEKQVLQLKKIFDAESQCLFFKDLFPTKPYVNNRGSDADSLHTITNSLQSQLHPFYSNLNMDKKSSIGCAPPGKATGMYNRLSSS